MFTALYFWLALRLDSWEHEPFCSCLGLGLFMLFDLYFIMRLVEWVSYGRW